MTNKKDELLLAFFFYLCFALCLRNSSTLWMNLYIGGPSNTANKTPMIKNSFQLIAMTGLQASALISNTDTPLINLLFIGYFSIGILMP